MQELAGPGAKGSLTGAGVEREAGLGPSHVLQCSTQVPGSVDDVGSFAGVEAEGVPSGEVFQARLVFQGRRRVDEVSISCRTFTHSA